MGDARALLDAERARTARRVAALDAHHEEFVAASRDTNADDEHDPEGATIAFERSQVGALLAAATAHLHELDAADQRLASGAYGVCERCRQAIGEARLEARPAARLCIRCACSS